MCSEEVAHTACRSRIRALKSPGFPSIKTSTASGSMEYPSPSNTLCVILRICTLPTRLNWIFSANRMIRSLLRRQLLPLPHRRIGSLQVMMIGCSVFFSKLSNSALPPESPLIVAASSSSGDRILLILSSDNWRNPPERWSTSSKSITVLESLSPPFVKASNEMC